MRLKCGQCQQVTKAEPVVEYARYKCGHCGAVNEVLNVSIKEWLGFNYADYVEEIIAFIRKDKFTLLLGVTPEDLKRGKLSKAQISKLKAVLIDGFEEGRSMRVLRDNILAEVKPKRLRLLKRNGEPSRVMLSPAVRSLLIARTETTRTSNEGSRAHYKDQDVKEFKWLATLSERTCPVCESRNGNIYPINSSIIPPAHALCRCTIIPVVEAG